MEVYPYEPSFLLKAIGYYEGVKNLPQAARYYYLYGLRTQSTTAYEQALTYFLDFGQIRAANRTANKLMRLGANDPESLYFISKYYYNLKNYQKALSVLIRAYSLAAGANNNPKLAFDIGNTLARLYLLLGEKEKAVQLSQNISNLAGNDIEALAKLAKLYKSLGLAENLNDCIRRIQDITITKGKQGWMKKLVKVKD